MVVELYDLRRTIAHMQTAFLDDSSSGRASADWWFDSALKKWNEIKWKLHNSETRYHALPLKNT